MESRQGSLLIRSDEAEVEKFEGKVRKLTLRGDPAYMEQQVEQTGRVNARARVIDYQVRTGVVTLSGNAEVQHPQYEIRGDVLKYDLNAQHFEGNGTRNGNGRIHIRMDPEVVPAATRVAPGNADGAAESDSGDEAATDQDG